MENTKIERIGSWAIEHFLESEYTTNRFISSVEKWLKKKWLPAKRKFPCENPAHVWGGLKKFKMPSPIICMELSSLPGELEQIIYSIEPRPVVGLLPHITKYRPEHRKDIRNATYNLAGFIQIGNFVQDDCYFAEKVLGISYYTQIPYATQPQDYHMEVPMNPKQLQEYQKLCLENQFFWVRHDSEVKYPVELLELLESISLVPVRGDGCRSEFMVLGIAERLSPLLRNDVSWEIIRQVLPWDKSFVIKPVQGTWGKEVAIYHAKGTEAEKTDLQEQIKNLVQTLGPEHLMMQPYIPTRIVERDEKKYYEIWKLYFVYLDGAYIFTGGLVQGSPLENVHGIKDTYFRPLITR